MVQDIADCLVWAQESGEKFHFDKVRNSLIYSLLMTETSDYNDKTDFS